MKTSAMLNTFQLNLTKLLYSTTLKKKLEELNMKYPEITTSNKENGV
jgi:hypothetical protein